MRQLLFVWLFSLTARAQGPSQAPMVPGKHIPPVVLMELRSLENQFDLALGRDCAIERCVSKGCSYQDHTVVDLPRNTSMPGFNQTESLGSVPPQEYLTQAHCDFVHEKSVPMRDVQALVKRLEQRLSRGWLRVTVGRQILEPISASLRESPLEKPVLEPKPVPPAPTPIPPVEVKPKWESEVALRELWLTLLPHFWWMLGVFLLATASAFLIWAARRVGRESLEEKALLAQLSSEKNSTITPLTNSAAEMSVSNLTALTPAAIPIDPFVAEQKIRWNERLGNDTNAAPNEQSNAAISGVLRDWLKAQRFDLLAKANLQFGERISDSLPLDGALAQHKVEFSHYLKQLDVASLPSDGDFYRALNQQAISSSVLSQSDAQSFHGLREEFGSQGLVQLIQSLPARFGALLFGMISNESQREVARMLPDEIRLDIASALLASRRIAQTEREYLFVALNAARAGRPMPAPPASTKHETIDRGFEFDGPTAVSEIMAFIEPAPRAHIFEEALGRANGAFPSWYEDILYPQMLGALEPELRTDVLLQIESKSLGAWISMQNATWQQGFLQTLPNSLQNALKSNAQFDSSAERARQATLARRALSRAVQNLVAAGKLALRELFV